VGSQDWDQSLPRFHQSGQSGVGLDTKKKTLVASEQDEAERAAWREQAKELPTQDLVIVDETGSRINMTPLYAYAQRGKRAIGKVPTPLRGEPDPDCLVIDARYGGSDAAGRLSRCCRL
jgi:hypothetical protein